jgi:subtilisin family serine protease
MSDSSEQTDGAEVLSPSADPQDRPDRHVRKLHPWLRVVKNGDQIVNAVRSDASSRVACSSPVGEPGFEAAPVFADVVQVAMALPRWTEAVQTAPTKLPKRVSLEDRPRANDSYVNIFIEFYPDRDGTHGAVEEQMRQVEEQILSQQPKSAESLRTEAKARGNMLCATVPITMLAELTKNPAIAYVHPSDPLTLDRPQIQAVAAGAKPRSKAVGKDSVHGRGKDVLIGIIDVGGFDFAHPDFLDENGQTRFIAIWDQGGDFRQPPEKFARGSQFRQSHLNAAIAAAKQPGMPPAAWIEKQSQLQPGSHGTHVASIAAGNSGVCPEARIAAVLVDVPAIEDEAERRRSTFSDTSSITHAVEYLLDIAREENLPISINISLGTNGGSHDGASGVSRLSIHARPLDLRRGRQCRPGEVAERRRSRLDHGPHSHQRSNSRSGFGS